MLENIEINCHSSIKISKGVVIYFDPFKIEKEMHDADIIFITHSHYDHYSQEDINKIIKEDTIIVAPRTTKQTIEKTKNCIFVEPNEEYEIKGITVNTIPAYNIDKQFHPKTNEWVGYILNIDNVSYYIAGDTDITPENKNVKCEVAFVPVGGTYTMDYKEAAELVNIIKPKIAVPTHYACIVGSKDDGEKFKTLLDKDIKCELLI